MNNGKKAFWGVLFLLGAVAAVVGGLGLLKGIGFWTILFSIVLIGVLVEGLIRKSWGQILFSAAFLLILGGKAMGGLPISIWLVLGAALLGTIGLNILFPRKHGYMDYIRTETTANWSAEEYSQIVGADGGESVNCEVSFGSSAKYITSQNLKNANLEVSFGGMSVYYDNAVLRDHCAGSRIDVSFGHMELYIPQDWNVVVNVTSSFAHVQEKGCCNRNGINTLMLVGDVSFGNVDIFYI